MGRESPQTDRVKGPLRWYHVFAIAVIIYLGFALAFRPNPWLIVPALVVLAFLALAGRLKRAQVGGEAQGPAGTSASGYAGVEFPDRSENGEGN